MHIVFGTLNNLQIQICKLIRIKNNSQISMFLYILLTHHFVDFTIQGNKTYDFFYNQIRSYCYLYTNG